MRQCHEWTTQAYTFRIHVRHEKGRGAQGEGCKGWLKRAEGHKILGGGCSAPLFWSSWNTEPSIYTIWYLLLSLISKGKNPSHWCCVIECRCFTNCETLKFMYKLKCGQISFEELSFQSTLIRNYFYLLIFTCPRTS